jgi:hypothetical protein
MSKIIYNGEEAKVCFTSGIDIIIDNTNGKVLEIRL